MFFRDTSGQYLQLLILDSDGPVVGLENQHARVCYWNLTGSAQSENMLQEVDSTHAPGIYRLQIGEDETANPGATFWYYNPDPAGDGSLPARFSDYKEICFVDSSILGAASTELSDTVINQIAETVINLAETRAADNCNNGCGC